MIVERILNRDQLYNQKLRQKLEEKDSILLINKDKKQNQEQTHNQQNKKDADEKGNNSLENFYQDKFFKTSDQIETVVEDNISKEETNYNFFKEASEQTKNGKSYTLNIRA